MNQSVVNESKNAGIEGPGGKSQPARLSTLIDTATASGRFTSFVGCVRAADLNDIMNANGSFTVFAPTDEAFKKLPASALEALRKNTGKLKAILNYHIIPGYWTTRDLKPGEVMTLQGTKLTIDVASSEVKVNEARVTHADFLAINGVMHAIDTLMLPKNWRLVASAA